MIELDKGAQDCINTILRNRGIAEVKAERGNVVVVDISRKVKYKGGEVQYEHTKIEQNDPCNTEVGGDVTVKYL